MKENNEDFNLDEIPERELFVHHVSYKDETYTFYISCCILTVNGEENVCSVDIVLHPKEVMEIRDYFFLRGKHWEEYVTPKFNEHSPELYKKINAAVQELWRQSDEYQESRHWDMSEADINRDLVPIWPDKLFEEMDIKQPNATIWTVVKGMEDYPGCVYPIYLEPKYIAQIKDILEMKIWDDEKHCYNLIDINELSENHKDLCKAIEVRTNETLVYAYGRDESNLPCMNHYLWVHSLPKDSSLPLSYAHYDPIGRI